MAIYQVLVRDQLGSLVGVMDSWRTMSYEKRLNDWAPYTLSLAGDDDKLGWFELDGLVTVMRRDDDASLGWYPDYVGFHRTIQNEITEVGADIAVSYGRSLMDLIRRRKLSYYAGTTFSTKHGPVETLIKEFVDENAGPGAAAAQRQSGSGPVPGLSIEADSGLGPIWSGSKAWEPLLPTIQELALYGSIDFDVVLNVPASAFMFQTYYPQRGLDRTVGNASGNPPVILAPELGNLAHPLYADSRTEEVTAVLALGSGEGQFRLNRWRTSAAALDSPFNYIEENYDARNEDTADALIAAADMQLAKLGRKESLSFTVLQAGSATYGKDYDLGDKVTVRFKDIAVNKRIIGIRVQVAEGKEVIDVTVSDDFLPIPRTLEEAFLFGVRNLTTRIIRLENSGPV